MWKLQSQNGHLTINCGNMANATQIAQFLSRYGEHWEVIGRA